MGGSSSAHARGIHEEEPLEDSASGLTILTPEKREEEKNYEEGLGEQREKSQGIEGEASCGALRSQEDDGAAGERETEESAGRNGKVGDQGSHKAAEIQGDDGIAGERGTEGHAGRNGKVIHQPANHIKSWILAWFSMVLVLLVIPVSTASGVCAVESTVPGCYQYREYQQIGVPYGTSGVLEEFSGTQYLVKLVWISGSQEFNCKEVDYHTGCNISTLTGVRNDTCKGIYPFISLQPSETGKQTLTANVTEKGQYCMAVDVPEYFWVHQGGVFPTNNPPAVSPVTCPAVNVTRPIETGCVMDSTGRIMVGSICSFAYQAGSQEGAVLKVCLLNGTWTTTGSNCAGPQNNIWKWLFLASLMPVVILVVYVIVVKKRSQNHYDKLTLSFTKGNSGGDTAVHHGDADPKAPVQEYAESSADSGAPSGLSTRDGSFAEVAAVKESISIPLADQEDPSG